MDLFRSLLILLWCALGWGRWHIQAAIRGFHSWWYFHILSTINGWHGSCPNRITLQRFTFIWWGMLIKHSHVSLWCDNGGGLAFIVILVATWISPYYSLVFTLPLFLLLIYALISLNHNHFYVCRVLLQDFSPNSFVEDDKVSESSIADIARFIPKIPMSPSPSMTHVVSIGQLLESVIFPQPLIFVLKHASVYLPLCTPMDELACRSRI